MNGSETEKKDEKDTSALYCTSCSGLGRHTADCKASLPKPPEEPVYNFPKFGPEEYGGHHFDKHHSVLWVGIQIDPRLQDFQGASIFLRTFDHILWQLYAEVVKQIRLQQALARGAERPLPPPPGGR